MITEQSKMLFLAYAADAINWNGEPLVGGSKEERGNLTQLKVAGLVETFRDEGQTWLSFTAAGKALARENGIEVG
jgi:hypothetical protein